MRTRFHIAAREAKLTLFRLRSFIGFLSLAGLLIYYLVFSPASPHPLVDPHPGDTAIAVLFVVRYRFLSERPFGPSC